MWDKREEKRTGENGEWGTEDGMLAHACVVFSLSFTKIYFFLKMLGWRWVSSIQLDSSQGGGGNANTLNQGWEMGGDYLTQRRKGAETAVTNRRYSNQ
jgi:hypothetical protein